MLHGKSLIVQRFLAKIVASKTKTTISQSFFSRKMSFKEKLVGRVGSLFEFVRPEDKVIIVSGGFKEEEEAHCSDTTVDVDVLKCNHKEADTRIVFHIIHNNGYAQNVVALVRDTDVLLLLLAHRNRITSTVWIAAGTSKNRKFVPLDDIYWKLLAGPENAILQFHAITGCDTTSYLFGHSKKTAWNVLKDHFHLLLSLGEGILTKEKLQRAETLVCRLYRTNVSSVNIARNAFQMTVSYIDKGVRNFDTPVSCLQL